MFYFSLENQVHMMIVVVFSSYIYLSSFTIKALSSSMKHFGTAFFIPLLLCMMSFLSFNKEHSASYLFFAEFILITALFLILLFEKNKDFTYVIFFLLYALPLGISILNLNFDSLHRTVVFDFLIAAYLGILIIVLISCILLKRKNRQALYWGMLAVCASLMSVRLGMNGIAVPISLIVKATGYFIFSRYFYQSTVYQLQQEHSKSRSQLERINENVQREVTRRVEEIERSNRKLVEISKTDSLTGVYTKKAILSMMDSMITKKPNSEFSILMFDIDNFKTVNDVHGHITGDKCIKNLVSIAKHTFRGDDVIGRFGGDEFIILLPDTSPVKAYLVADRFRKNVEKTNDPHYTVSIGVASYPLDGTNSRQLVTAADKALYHSKEKGRNMVSHTGQLK
ncbi:MAG: diguanylate cyclase [Clostridiaceae bacterium]|jgi:diguanylate cyclase (GGDEF)-like protein|nr:diguanylate cyclase [Clostridiaceae bacterium]